MPDGTRSSLHNKNLARLDLRKKLSILAAAARYDPPCASSGGGARAPPPGARVTGLPRAWASVMPVCRTRAAAGARRGRACPCRCLRPKNSVEHIKHEPRASGGCKVRRTPTKSRPAGTGCRTNGGCPSSGDRRAGRERRPRDRGAADAGGGPARPAAGRPGSDHARGDLAPRLHRQDDRLPGAGGRPHCAGRRSAARRRPRWVNPRHGCAFFLRRRR